MAQEIGSFDIPYRPTYFEFGYSIMSGYGGPPDDRTIVWDLSHWDGTAAQYLVVDRPDWLGTAGLIVRPPDNWLDDVVWQPFGGRIEAFELAPQPGGSVHVSIRSGQNDAAPEPTSLTLAFVFRVVAVCTFLFRRRRRLKKCLNAIHASGF